MEYFIIDKNGQQAGPFSLDQLAQKAITPETLVWAQGMADWTPAWKVEELKTVLEAAEAIRDNEATQEEATTGTVPPSYQPEQPQKKSSKTLWKIILGLVVFIILMLAVTNPGADAHKEKVRTEVSKAVEKATETTDNNFFSQAMRSVAKMMAGTVMDEAMDQLFQYHNYIICSKGTVKPESENARMPRKALMHTARRQTGSRATMQIANASLASTISTMFSIIAQTDPASGKPAGP